jgi:aquaporin Z
MYMLNKCLVEFLGTLLLVYVVLATGDPLAIGAAVTVAILVGDKISGGNFNPAVTLGLTLSNRQSYNLAIPYIFAQLGGAYLAMELHKQIKF